MNTIIEEMSDPCLYCRRRLRFEIFRRDRFTCQYCGRKLGDGIKLTLDHVFPKSKGGEFSADNLITACRDCNVGKWTDVLSGYERRELKKMHESIRKDDLGRVGWLTWLSKKVLAFSVISCKLLMILIF